MGNNKKILEKIRQKLEKELNIKLFIDKIEVLFSDDIEDCIYFLEEVVLSEEHIDKLKEYGELEISFILNKIDKKINIKTYRIVDTKCPFDIDITSIISNKSLKEIIEMFEIKEDISKYCSTFYTKVELKIDKNLNIVDRIYKTIDFYIDNEGGEDIYFYENNNKIFEKNTGKEIKGLLDIGGQYCVRLIPILGN